MDIARWWLIILVSPVCSCFLEDSSESKSLIDESIQDVRYYLSISTPSLFKVKSYESEIKKIYIYKVNYDNSITGLVHELIDEPQEVSKWFKIRKSKSSKLSWQMQTFKGKLFKFINHLKPPINISSMFIKYVWNRILAYGDGGFRAWISYLQNLELAFEAKIPKLSYQITSGTRRNSLRLAQRLSGHGHYRPRP